MFQSFLLPDSLRLLYVLRFKAKIRRACRLMTSPRSALLSTITVVLPLAWAVNFAASMFLRERFSPESFRLGVLATGLGYSLWYVLKASITRPAAAIEWTPAEQAWLCGGPFERSELIRYRLAVIFGATLFKAAACTLIFVPELSFPGISFVGILLGLAFLDLARMGTEIVVCGISARAFRVTRGVVLVAAGAVTGSTVVATLLALARERSELPAALAFPLMLIRQVLLLSETSIGRVLSLPLTPFVEVITAVELSWSLAGWAAASMALVSSMCALVFHLDALFAQRSAEAVRQAYGRSSSARTPRRLAARRLPRVLRLQGAGPIAWRQWLGIRKYQTGLLVALSVPAALSFLPLMQKANAVETFLNVAGALCLYSFLLLPSALKFDFRRDYDRLPILKSLPVRPLAIVIGQLATPVAVTTLLQVFVLSTTFLIRPVPFVMVINAVLLILPLNVAIFGLDNLIYLMYPYRQSEEGLQPFVRATLTFTAKGLLFGVALTFVYLWAISCRSLSHMPLISELGDHRLLFAAGIWLMTSSSAMTVLLLSARVFERFDPATDYCA